MTDVVGLRFQDAPWKTGDPVEDVDPREAVWSPMIWDFHRMRVILDDRQGTAGVKLLDGPDMDLTPWKLEELASQALRDRARRKDAYHRRRDRMIADGLSPREFSVPEIYADEFRTLCRAMVKAAQTGQAFDVSITTIGYAREKQEPPFTPNTPEASQDAPDAAQGYLARRRAQAARARARKKARGLIRVTLVLPDALRPRITRFAEEITARFKTGELLQFEASVDDTPPDNPEAEALPSPRPDIPAPEAEAAPARLNIADLFTDDPDEDALPALFADIHATKSRDA